MTWSFHPDALFEFEDAAAYYAKCQSGLELRFIAAVEDAISRILADPLKNRKLDEQIRRCLVRIFPYAVLYSIQNNHIIILAIMHCHRKPGYWKNRAIL